jgi:hypothetical protein
MRRVVWGSCGLSGAGVPNVSSYPFSVLPTLHLAVLMSNIVKTAVYLKRTRQYFWHSTFSYWLTFH